MIFSVNNAYRAARACVFLLAFYVTIKFRLRTCCVLAVIKTENSILK